MNALTVRLELHAAFFRSAYFLIRDVTFRAGGYHSHWSADRVGKRNAEYLDFLGGFVQQPMRPWDFRVGMPVARLPKMHNKA
jgi:hypothetical protein